jgi:hypothetical protein
VHVPPDRRPIDVLLSRVRRRLDIRAAAEGAAAGLALSVVATLAGWPARPAGTVSVAAACVVAGMLIRILIVRRSHPSVAAFVEHGVPASRNVILTAHEIGDVERPSSPVTALVVRRAAEVARGVDVRALVPVHIAAIAFAAMLAAWLFTVAAGRSAIATGRGPFRGALSNPSMDAVDITITPPAYAHRTTRTLRDPARIEALAGSHLTIRARAHAQTVILETLSSSDSLVPRDGAFIRSIIASADGFLALEPRAGARTGGRRLIGLSIVPDSAPKISIKAPGHDVRLPDGHRTLEVAIEAGDDIGLGSLRLHYTKVSGSGERFTFSEGDVPIAVTRRDDRAWTAHASWKLDPLELGPGDMVVYRAIATDQRPGGAPSESDSYIAEVAAAGGEAAAGFAVDPEQDRYAVSQQMVILKTERLLARRTSMPAEDYRGEAEQIAAEQRKVRAEFVFMLGGELADAPDVAASMTEINEEAEAEGESDILAGRNANAGHVALLRAIRAMSRAAAALTTADLEPALPHERAALTQLESAFSHTRILLRALSTRERLDLSRRLTGVLTDAIRDERSSPEPAVDARTVELRRALSDIASVAGRSTFDDSSAARLALVAERVLRVDAGSKPLQDVARIVNEASHHAAAGDGARTRRSLDQAAGGLAAVLRAAFIDAPRPDRSLDGAQLAGALRDAQQREGRRP